MDREQWANERDDRERWNVRRNRGLTHLVVDSRRNTSPRDSRGGGEGGGGKAIVARKPLAHRGRNDALVALNG